MSTQTMEKKATRPDAAAWDALAASFHAKDDARAVACIGIGAFLSSWDGMTTRAAADGLTDAGYPVTYQTVNAAATAYALARVASVAFIPVPFVSTDDDGTPDAVARAALTDDATGALGALWSLTDALGVNGIKAALLDDADDDGTDYDTARAARVLSDAVNALSTFRALRRAAAKGGGGQSKADAAASVLDDYAPEFAAASAAKKADAAKKKADAQKKADDDARQKNGTAPLSWDSDAAWGALCGILTDAAHALGRAAQDDDRGAAYGAALAPWASALGERLSLMADALAPATDATERRRLAAERAAADAAKKDTAAADAAALAASLADAADGRTGAMADALTDAAAKKGAAPRRTPARHGSRPAAKKAA